MSSAYDKFTTTKHLGLSVNDAVLKCAKAINESPKFTLEEMDVEGGIVKCLYTFGLNKYYDPEHPERGTPNSITLVFNDDGSGGTVCTGRIYNEYVDKYTICSSFAIKLAAPTIKKMLAAAMDLF